MSGRNGESIPAWANEVFKAPQSKASPVVFVVTEDLAKPTILLKAAAKLVDTNGGKGQAGQKPPFFDLDNVFLYDPFEGLFAVEYEEKGGRWSFVGLKRMSLGGHGGLGFDIPPNPMAIFRYVTEKLRLDKGEGRARGGIFVILRADAIAERLRNSVPNLDDALHSLMVKHAQNPRVFGRSLVVLFVRSTEPFSKDVLDNALIVTVAGAERKELVEYAKAIVSDLKRREGESFRRMLEEVVGGADALAERRFINQLVDAACGLTLQQFKQAIQLGRFEGVLRPEFIARIKEIMLRARGLGRVITPDTAVPPEKIGGYEDVKRVFRLIARKAEEPEKARALGCGPVRGILLFGPPGCGKSLFCEALAKMLKRPVIALRASDIFTMWYGESTRRLTAVIELAEKVGAVLFIDEVESLVGTRGGPGSPRLHEETHRVLGELLHYLGRHDRKAIVVATTNRPDLLDEAFLRAGRFDYVIHVGYPDRDAREEIFRVHIFNPIDHPPVKIAPDVDIGRLADMTKGFTGAEIAEVVRLAADMAFEEGADRVRMEHFVEAIKAVKPDETEREAARRMYEEFAKKFCRGVLPRRGKAAYEAVDIPVVEQAGVVMA